MQTPCRASQTTIMPCARQRSSRKSVTLTASSQTVASVGRLTGTRQGFARNPWTWRFSRWSAATPRKWQQLCNGHEIQRDVHWSQQRKCLKSFSPDDTPVTPFRGYWKPGGSPCPPPLKSHMSRTKPQKLTTVAAAVFKSPAPASIELSRNLGDIPCHHPRPAIQETRNESSLIDHACALQPLRHAPKHGKSSPRGLKGTLGS